MRLSRYALDSYTRISKLDEFTRNTIPYNFKILKGDPQAESSSQCFSFLNDYFTFYTHYQRTGSTFIQSLIISFILSFIIEACLVDKEIDRLDSNKHLSTRLQLLC